MLIGKELGPYHVDKELGSGAMGTVFRAKNKQSGARVAIKLMSIALGSNENAVNRFKREVDIIKQLNHPNIVRYINSGRYHKAPFIIMEFVEGESLDHILHRRARLPWEEVVKIGIDLCAALQHAHDQGIIHRDLKPSNLMILKDGTVKLTDFGIAKDADVTALTADNSTVGTVAYMSPEQCRGVRDITHKTDLYSMGIMFYELLTGRKPFVGDTPMAVFQQHANQTQYKRPAELVTGLPRELNALVDSLMAKDPKTRGPKDPKKRVAKGPKKPGEDARMVANELEKILQHGATKSKVDPGPGDKPPDAEEKEAAYVKQGKEKKAKATPFYAKGWFTIVALALVASLAAVGAYFAFLRVPGAETLFTQADTLMASRSEDDRKSARESAALFLRHYPDHEKAEAVRQLADRFDFETLDKQMHNRRNSALKFKPGEEEAMFNKALDLERPDGNLAEAAALWEKLSAKKGSADPEMHAWGLLGAHYLKDHKDAEDLYEQLKLKAKRKDASGSDAVEQAGLDAMRLEIEEKNSEAKEKWDELARKSEAPRRWLLLAARQSRALRAAK